MAWYKTGTITVTNGSTTVTGSGTSWIANAGVGEALYAPDGRLYEITNIASDTSFTIAPAYLGSTQSGQAYVLVPSQSYIRDLASQAADLVNNYSTIYNTIGQGKFPDGTLADPAFKFSDDLDTGFYRSATNEVTFVAGGVAQFKYNASGLQFTGSLASPTFTGNVTLSSGTANGVTYLNGSKVLTSGSALTFDGASFTVGASSTTADYKTFIQKASGELLGLNASSGTLTRIAFGNTAASFGNTQIIANAADLAFITSSAEQMRLTSTGLGVGTSSPASSVKLTVYQTDLFAVQLMNANQNYTFRIDSGVSNALILGNRTSFLDLLTVTTSGNLGLGVTPSAWGSAYKAIDVNTRGLSFAGGTESGAVSVNAYWNFGWKYAGTSTYRVSQYNQFDGSHEWLTAPSGTAGNPITFTQAMTLTASGNLGVGTTSPTYKLDVSLASGASLARFSGPEYCQVVVTDGTRSIYQQVYGNEARLFTGTATPLLFGTNDTERARITSSGNLLVGTTTAVANGGVLQVSNGITFPATQSACADANTLDDYEEGTWTPTLSGTTTYTTQTGRYTKVGRLVTFMGDLTIDVQGTGDAGVINGLPFSASGNNPVYVGYFSGLGATVSSISPFLGGTSINIYGVSTPSSTAASLPLMVSGARLMFQGSYEV